MVDRYRLFFLACALGVLTLSAGVAMAQIPVQIVNSSPDPALSFVDVYIDGTLVADNLAFKAATPFVDGMNNPVTLVTPTSVVDIADQNSVDNSSPILSTTLALTPNTGTLLDLIGLQVPGNFDPNPDGRDTSLQLIVFEAYKPLADDPNSAELMAIHAAPNVGTVDLVARAVYNNPGVGLPIFTNLAYGDVLPYVALTPSVVALDMVESGTSNVIETWAATLGLIQGAAAVGHAGGILTQPDNEGLSLFGAIANGFVFELATASRTDVPDVSATMAQLGQNYPNPYNPSTTIPFTLFTDQHVSLKVYDLKGREIATLIDKPMVAGSYDVPFHGDGLASGAYLYKLRTADGVRSNQMVLVK